jgi:hypothetical protein
MKTDWQEMAPPTLKGSKMPMTQEYFYKVLAMDQELILEQREEIQRLKMTINQLRQKT